MDENKPDGSKPGTAPGKPKYQLSAVTFDCAPEGTAIPAYLNDLRWKCWRMPHFPESSMAQVMAVCTEVSYDPERDAYLVAHEDDPNDPWVVPAETITTADGQDVKVYAVGAGYWCWDETDLPTTPA